MLLAHGMLFPIFWVLAAGKQPSKQSSLAVEVSHQGLLRAEVPAEVTLAAGSSLATLANGPRGSWKPLRKLGERVVKDHITLPFPPGCPRGRLDLHGKYVHWGDGAVARSKRNFLCVVRGHGATVKVMSGSELWFKDVIFEGDISFSRSRVSKALTDRALVRAERMYIQDSLASVKFEECHGTGLSTHHLEQSDGHLSFLHCGGGSWSALESADLIQTGGVMKFQQCRCICDGGGAHVSSSMRQTGGKMEFAECSAWSGGGLYSHKLYSANGVLAFRNCTAEYTGGCLAAFGSLSLMRTQTETSGNVLFQNCSSMFDGGAISAQDMQQVQIRGAVHFHGCAAGSTWGGVISAIHNVDKPLNNLEASLVDLPAESATLKELKERIECALGSFYGPSEAFNRSLGCQPCEAGTLRVNGMPGTNCEPCPDQAEICLPGRLQMRRGFMVQDVHDPSLRHTRTCPNPQACRGQAPGRMCQDGYASAGCAECAAGYGMSDASVLLCVKCAESPWVTALQVCFWLGKNVLIVGLAAKSVLGASQEAKSSSIFLNQLLSFATVAGTIVSAMLQTPAGEDLRNGVTGVLLQAVGIVMDVGSGQSASTGQSTQCLLEYFGLQPSLWKGQVAFAAMAATLTTALGVAKGWHVAILVGINCFFPSFLGHFGRQLVCFRLGEREDLYCPHAPGMGFAWVFAAMTLSTAVILAAWWRLYNHSEHSKSGESGERGESVEPLPVHVVFLTAPYHKAFAAWETERLLRKSTFTLLAAMLPVTASPALQMSSLGLVLLASLIMYMFLLPYETERWNHVEVALLTVSLMMTFAAVALLAGDLHWGHSYPVHVTTTVLVTIMAAIICGWPPSRSTT